MLCHTCGCTNVTVPRGVESDSQVDLTGCYTVDMHCHLFTPAVEALVADHPLKLCEAQDRLRLLGSESVRTNQAMYQTISKKLHDIDLRLADMERLRIDLQVLSPSPTQFYYWADEALSEEIVELQNEHIASVCHNNPTRFAGLGAISLQYPELATRQLRGIQEKHGLLGVEISSDPTGNGLDDPLLEPFWTEAARRGLVIFLHPLGTSLGERVNRYYLSNIIGQPLETTVALGQLIYGGVFDRHPLLKVLAAHGGGFLPYYSGRFDHGYVVRPESRVNVQAPSKYLSRIFFDTVVYDHLTLRHLVDRVGISQILAGTDYPFDMGEYQLHKLVGSVPEMDHKAGAAILGGNAMRLLGLTESQVPKGAAQ